MVRTTSFRIVPLGGLGEGRFRKNMTVYRDPRGEDERGRTPGSVFLSARKRSTRGVDPRAARLFFGYLREKAGPGSARSCLRTRAPPRGTHVPARLPYLPPPPGRCKVPTRVWRRRLNRASGRRQSKLDEPRPWAARTPSLAAKAARGRITGAIRSGPSASSSSHGPLRCPDCSGQSSFLSRPPPARVFFHNAATGNSTTPRRSAGLRQPTRQLRRETRQPRQLDNSGAGRLDQTPRFPG